jgi:hypothetical protein
MSNKYKVVDRDASISMPFEGQQVTYTVEDDEGRRFTALVHGDGDGDREKEQERLAVVIAQGGLKNADDD